MADLSPAKVHVNQFLGSTRAGVGAPWGARAQQCLGSSKITPHYLISCERRARPKLGEMKLPFARMLHHEVVSPHIISLWSVDIQLTVFSSPCPSAPLPLCPSAPQKTMWRLSPLISHHGASAGADASWARASAKLSGTPAPRKLVVLAKHLSWQ